MLVNHSLGGRTLQHECIAMDCARKAAFLTIILSALGAARGGEIACYVKKPTWGPTLLAAQEAYQQWWATQLGDVTLGPWHATSRKDVFSQLL